MAKKKAKVAPEEMLDGLSFGENKEDKVKFQFVKVSRKLYLKIEVDGVEVFRLDKELIKEFKKFARRGGRIEEIDGTEKATA